MFKDGTASSLLYPLLVALGIIGGGVAIWQYDKKRQYLFLHMHNTSIKEIIFSKYLPQALS